MSRLHSVQLSLIPQANDLCNVDGTPNARRIRKIVYPDLSAEKLAALLGVPAGTWRSWEYEKKGPSGAALSLLKLAAYAPDLVRSVLGDGEDIEGAMAMTAGSQQKRRESEFMTV